MGLGIEPANPAQSAGMHTHKESHPFREMRENT
jgi:hypothetical protein